MIDLTKEIQAFCDRSWERYDLSLPFRQGRFVVATNGRAIIACQPSVYRGELANGKVHVPETRKFLRFPPGITWEMCLPEPPLCKECDGTGLVPQRCPRCDQATPDIPCETCRVMLFGRRLHWHLVTLFRGLPDCEWGAPPEYGERPEPDPVWFRFTGGRGIAASLDSAGRIDGPRI